MLLSLIPNDTEVNQELEAFITSTYDIRKRKDNYKALSADLKDELRELNKVGDFINSKAELQALDVKKLLGDALYLLDYEKVYLHMFTKLLKTSMPSKSLAIEQVYKECNVASVKKYILEDEDLPDVKDLYPRRFLPSLILNTVRFLKKMKMFTTVHEEDFVELDVPYDISENWDFMKPKGRSLGSQSEQENDYNRVYKSVNDSSDVNRMKEAIGSLKTLIKLSRLIVYCERWYDGCSNATSVVTFSNGKNIKSAPNWFEHILQCDVVERMCDDVFTKKKFNVDEYVEENFTKFKLDLLMNKYANNAVFLFFFMARQNYKHEGNEAPMILTPEELEDEMRTVYHLMFGLHAYTTIGPGKTLRPNVGSKFEGGKFAQKKLKQIPEEEIDEKDIDDVILGAEELLVVEDLES